MGIYIYPSDPYTQNIKKKKKVKAISFGNVRTEADK